MDVQANYNDISYEEENDYEIDEINSVKKASLTIDDGKVEQLHVQSIDLDDKTNEDIYFNDSLCQATQGGPVRDNNASSLTSDLTDDNDLMFNPTQKLNFDDDSGDDELSDGELVLKSPEKLDLCNERYLTNRPLTNGSDVAESGTYGAPSNQGTDQGQNIRIIEGHDSSLVDDGSLAFGFNFHPSHNVNISNAPKTNQSGLISSKSEDSIHNMYDSLERIDCTNLSGANNENVIVSSADYSNTGMIMPSIQNLQGSESDSLWAQDDNTDVKNYLSNLPHNQQYIYNNQCNDDQIKHQSPPRNFQADASSINFNRRIGSGDDIMINAGGLGEGLNPRDESNDLNLELSEEGLLNSTQMYAQPLAAVGHLTIEDNVTSSVIGEHLHSQNHIDEDFTSVNMGNVNHLCSQPKNMSSTQGHLSSEVAKENHHSEGDGLDERQAGAGSSSSLVDQNQSAGGVVGHQMTSERKSAPGKAQTRRPAVQGSASSGNNKRSSSVMNPRPGSNNISAPLRKAAPSASSGRLSGTGDSLKRFAGGARKKVPYEGNSTSSQISVAVHNQAIKQPPQTALSNQNSRANSQTSLVSNQSTTNSRMSGVGKESQHYIFRTSSQPGTSADNNTLQSSPDQYCASNFPHSSSISSLLNNKPNKSYSLDKMWSNKIQIPSQHLLRQSHSYGMPYTGSNLKNPLVPGLGLPDENPLAKGQSQQTLLSQQQFLHDKQVQPQEQQAHHLGYVQLQQPYNQSTSPRGSDVNHRSINQEHVVSQMEAMKKQGQKFSPNEQAVNQRNQVDGDVHGIDEVRSHLQNMLQLSSEPSTAEDQSDAVGYATGFIPEQTINKPLHFDTDVNSYFGNNNHEDMSDILENFPAFSSKMFSDMPTNPLHNESNHGELLNLRETLEKECYRRKHCEEQIQKLNSKLLETQQQLAVAVSTDKRKDIMIEQLDKQLAKVVEGWKKRESEKDDYLKVLSEEKEKIEESLQKQQKMINNFESELSQTVEELRIEKEHSSAAVAEVKKELNDAKLQMEKSEAMIEAERQKFSSVSKEWEDLKQSRQLAEQRAHQAQEQLIKEQDDWHTKERELLAKINEVKEANQKVINMEKVKHEEQKKKREESEAQLEEMKTELKRVVLDMEELIREKESQKVEIAIIEAKGESALRNLETDLHVQMEKEIADQAQDFHSKMESTMEEVADRHRKQVSELHARHQKDMEHQMAGFNLEREKKDEENRKQVMDLEDKLQEVRNENSSLKQSKLKLESQRMEILTKLQFMMQSQWNEAVSLLVSTPQKKNLNSSFMSSQASSQQLISTLTQGSSSLTNLDIAKSQPPSLSEDSDHPKVVSSQEENNSHRSDIRDREVEQRMGLVEEYLDSLEDPRHSIQNQFLAKDPHILSKIEDTVIDSKVSSDEKSDREAVSHETPPLHGYDLTHRGKTMISSSNIPDLHHQAVAMKPPHQSSSHQSLHFSDTHPAYARIQQETGRSLLSHLQETNYAQNSSNMTSLQLDNNSLPNIPRSQSITEHQTFPNSDCHTVPQSKLRNMCLSDKQPSSQNDSSPSSQQFGFYQFHPNTGLTHNSTSDPHDVKHNNQVDSADNMDHPESLLHHNMSAIPGYRQWLLQGIAQDKNFPESTYSQSNAFSQASIPQPCSKESGMNMSSLSPVRVSRSGTSSQTSALTPVKHTGRPQSASFTDHLDESLSPPVKQSAHQEYSVNYVEPGKETIAEKRLRADYNHLSDTVDSQENRHGELQHYVKMLLSKAPGSVYSEPERDYPSEILESSRDLTVDLDLNDTDQALELNAQLRRLQHLRERQDAQQQMEERRGVPEQLRSSQSREFLPDYLNDLTAENGVISSQRLSEISHYLSMYRDQWEANSDKAVQQNVAGQLMEALKGMAANVQKNDQSTGALNRTEHSSEDFSKLQQSRKSKVRKSKNANQSADSSVADSWGSDKSSASRPIQTRKLAQSNEGAKERKQISHRQSTFKNGGGPVWK